MKKNRRNQLTPYGVKVKKALLERGWTQKEFCAREEIEESRFSEILYGQRPGDKYRRRINQALGIKEKESTEGGEMLETG